jgi:hypothetical protein
MYMYMYMCFYVCISRRRTCAAALGCTHITDRTADVSTAPRSRRDVRGPHGPRKQEEGKRVVDCGHVWA